MNKLVSISLGLLISCKIYCQDTLTAPVTYTAVVKVDSSLSSNELYARARAWFAETYRSARDVIQMDDKENGKIIGKGNIKYASTIFAGSEGTKGWISYTISVEVKNGRYKYKITDFYHEGNPLSDGGQFSFNLITNETDCPYKVGTMMGKGWRNKVWNDIKEDIMLTTTILTQSLKMAMGKPAKNKDADW